MSLRQPLLLERYLFFDLISVGSVHCTGFWKDSRVTYSSKIVSLSTNGNKRELASKVCFEDEVRRCV